MDRRELAKLRGCKDSTKFEGALCTNRCEYRSVCEVKRIKFLIQAQANEVRLTGKVEKIRGVICSVDILIGWRREEYIIGAGVMK